jgi:DUF4097 and DUF4098 domain-containing protein YvlB
MASVIRRSSTTAVLMGALCALASAQQKKELHFSVQPGAAVSVTNDFGPVTVRAVTGSQVQVTATPHSSGVEIDSNQTGNRVDIRTHYLQKVSQSDGAVDYDVQVPPTAAIVVRTANGAVKVQNLNGDISVESDTGTVSVSGVSGAHVHARTMSGPIAVTDVTNGHVELSSVSGEVTVTNVTGPMVSVNTTGSPIRFSGDCSGGGDYSLTTHAGNIDVTLPPSASVDVTARSINGSVEDGFQLQSDSHPALPIAAGKSFAGHANTGSSSLRLRSFSGKITVRKQ